MTQTSTKPYLIRAIYEWCSDNGYRPYVAVAVDERTVVPREFVRDGEIVLNVSADATSGLRIGNESIEFQARFNRVAREVSIPIENVTAIYAAENGHGMAFDVPKALALPPEGEAGQPTAGEDASAGSAPLRRPALLEPVPTPQDAGQEPGEPAEPPPTPPGRPRLTRVK